MTVVKITKKDGSVIKIESFGHTGYADEGQDIVCAGLSCILQTALLGLLTVAKVNVKHKMDEATGYLEISLPSKLTQEQRHDSDCILNTALCGVSDLREGYSDFIKLEVNNVY